MEVVECKTKKAPYQGAFFIANMQMQCYNGKENNKIRKRGSTMPFIDSKITVTVSQEKREVLKSELGKAVSIIGKPEKFLMVGFEDNYDLYMAGKKLEKGAYVEVSLLGSAPGSAYENMTAAICKLLEKELGIPGDAVYVTYHGLNDWGWNGQNF